MKVQQFYTIGQAAEATGKAKSTIKKAIDNSELSVFEKTKRGFKIEASELDRVFPFLNVERTENVQEAQIETSRKAIENSVLRAKFEASEQRYEDAEKTIEDLRARLSKSDDERTRLTTMLTDQRPTFAEPSRKGFWARLIG